MWRETVALLLFLIPAAAEESRILNMGTLAPEGSLWHQVFQQMGEQWRIASQVKVKLRIYAGGVQGDEPDMIRRMRLGQLQVAGLSAAGLDDIEPAVGCLQIPMMLSSYEELDWVRDRLAPRLEKMLEAKGFVVLNWGDVGWVHFFTKAPATRLSELRSRRLFVWAGDNEELELWKNAGFKPVALPATEILTGSQTGLIDTFDTAPLMALSNQWFALAKYMIDVKWAPLTGALVVVKPAWDAIPAAERAAMLKIAQEAGYRLRGEIRKSGEAAVAAMQKRGLQVMQADGPALDDWRREAEAVYLKLRGKTIPAEMFDEVRRLRDEYRTRADSGKRSPS